MKRKNITLIVRLWAEYLEQSPPIWRGEIVEAGKKYHVYFTDLAEIEQIIRRLATAASETTGRISR